MRCLSLAAALFALSFGAARAGELLVNVTGVATPSGDIACALYASGEYFPLNVGGAKLQRAPAKASDNSCHFSGLAPGLYAVAVSQLRAGQANVDKDFLGRPKQPWGVSRGARHALCAPTFEEASFKVAAEGVTRISVAIAP